MRPKTSKGKHGQLLPYNTSIRDQSYAPPIHRIIHISLDFGGNFIDAESQTRY